MTEPIDDKSHLWARIGADDVFRGYVDSDSPDDGLADGERVVPAPLSPELEPGRWQLQHGTFRKIQFAHLAEDNTLVAIADEPTANSVIVPDGCDLVSQIGRQRWNPAMARFEPRTDANDPTVAMVALDSLAPRALAHLIHGLATAGKPDPYAVQWAAGWLASFDADQAERKAGRELAPFLPPQFRK